LRVLAFAEIEKGGVLAQTKPNDSSLKNLENYDDFEQGATFVGFACIKDPARPEVKDAISDCTTAGIRVIMITGDALQTAATIALRISGLRCRIPTTHNL
jgi:magnesium-transporting ATPase (P-type)